MTVNDVYVEMLQFCMPFIAFYGIGNVIVRTIIRAATTGRFEF